MTQVQCTIYLLCFVPASFFIPTGLSEIQISVSIENNCLIILHWHKQQRVAQIVTSKCDKMQCLLLFFMHSDFSSEKVLMILNLVPPHISHCFEPIFSLLMLTNAYWQFRSCILHCKEKNDVALKFTYTYIWVFLFSKKQQIILTKVRSLINDQMYLCVWFCTLMCYLLSMSS